MLLQLLPERFLADGLTGTVERVFDVAVVVAEPMIVAVATMMCMGVAAVVVDANNIAV